MKKTIALCLALLPLSATSAARAEDPAAPAPAAAPAANDTPQGGAFMADLKIGGLLSFGGLKANVRPAIGLGYIFGAANRSFAAQLQVDYTQPTQESGENDPRVTPGGAYDWHLKEQQLVLFPMFLYRLTSISDKLVPYAGIGPRIYMLRSTVKGTAGTQEIFETKEQSTKVGFGIPLGVQFTLGPGGLIGEVLLEYGPLDHKATGSSNTGAATLFLGYRFIL